MGAEVFGEEWKDVVLDAVGDFADVRAGIDFEFIGDCVVVHGFVKCLGIEAEAVLVSDVEEDAAILAETSDILIKKCERGVGGPFGEDGGLRLSIFGREIEKERRILGIGRPGGGLGHVGAGEEWEIGRIRGSFGGFDGLGDFGCDRFRSDRSQAARTHDVEGAEDVGMLHADARGAVAAHEWPTSPRARRSGMVR